MERKNGGGGGRPMAPFLNGTIGMELSKSTTSKETIRASFALTAPK
jgi:hypothetical protein